MLKAVVLAYKLGYAIGDKITDLSELFINCKEKVATIVGNTDNIKITTPIDIKIVNELIKKEEV